MSKRISLAAIAAAAVIGCYSPTETITPPPPPPTIPWQERISAGKMDSLWVWRAPELDDSVFMSEYGVYWPVHGFKARMVTSVPAVCRLPTSSTSAFWGDTDSAYVPTDSNGNGVMAIADYLFPAADSGSPVALSRAFRADGLSFQAERSFTAICRDSAGKFLTGPVGELIYWKPLDFSHRDSMPPAASTVTK